MTADPARWTRQALTVVALCFVLNMIDGVNVFTLTYVAPALQARFAAGPERFAMVFSAGLVGMGLGGMVLAPLADRFGRRPLILLALGLMAGAMIASALAPDIWTLAAMRVVVGLGIGTVLASITALAAAFAPTGQRHVAAGVPQAGYPVGATLAGFIVAAALPHYGWAAMFVGAGVATLALLPLCWLALPEAPAAGPRHVLPPHAALGGERRGATGLLWVCTISGFMALYFIASWITRLAIAAGLPPAQAILASAIYNAGACVGTIALSLCATRIALGKLIAAAMLGAAALFLVFGGMHLALPLALLTSFLIGITLQGGVNGNYPLVASIYPDDVRATGLGWAMGVGRVGALLGPLVGGWTMAAHWPLLAIFAVFCLPLLANAVAALLVRPPTGSATAA